MSVFFRAAGLLAAVLLAHGGASAATPKEIDAAIKKGTEAIKSRYKGNGAPGGDGIGATCLSGIALLEAGTPPADPAVKAITAAVRNAAYTQTRTYQVSLCLMYLDRHGDPADEPLIQVLAVRLLVAQTAAGGWGYETVPAVQQADEQRLRAIKPGQPGKLHPEVEKYGQAVAATAQKVALDDNSNTQFAILGVWLARKHGVPVDAALDLVEKRFLTNQSPITGGWNYSGPPTNEMAGSPSMYCAGLLGLATGVARREEKRTKTEPKKDPPKDDPGAKKDPEDPFFNPAPKAGKDEPKKPAPRPRDPNDRNIQFALAGLGQHVAKSTQASNGALTLGGGNGGHGHGDLYFFWSLERVGVVYGLDKIGGVDWYEAGAHTLVHAQTPGGNWTGGYGDEVGTAFAVLFLCKSNLARDLAGKVQNESIVDLKTARPGGEAKVGPGGEKIDPLVPAPFIPGATGSESATRAAEVVKAADKDWPTVLAKVRDAKGIVNTHALVAAIYRLDGDRRKAAREALAERLTRMSAKTLREMARDEDPELRRGAVLAMAMKDDKAHVPDLVDALLDEEDLIVRAARAGLKSLTGEDFGPAANATEGEKTLSVTSWKQWLAKSKK